MEREELEWEAVGDKSVLHVQLDGATKFVASGDDSGPDTLYTESGSSGSHVDVAVTNVETIVLAEGCTASCSRVEDPFGIRRCCRCIGVRCEHEVILREGKFLLRFGVLRRSIEVVA